MASKSEAVWEDREVLFDLPFKYLKLRPGERIFQRIEPVEDTKGNSGARGRLVLTNLRLIWHSLSSPRINMSIGLNSIVLTRSQPVRSGLRGSTSALLVTAAGRGGSRYEFLFSSAAPSLLAAVAALHRSYTGSRMYRDLKLRSAIIHNKQLRMLPLEKICLHEGSVWNLSSDAGTLGTMLVSNVRVVWYADVNEAFNVSMPYISIETIAVRDSKFGEALVVNTRQSSGGFVLGFRADPPSRLRPLLAELLALHRAYTDRPIFGVEVDAGAETIKPEVEDMEQLEEIGEPRGEMGPALYLASQLAQARGHEGPGPVYCPYLGLAVEPPQQGITLKSLFEVQTTT